MKKISFVIWILLAIVGHAAKVAGQCSTCYMLAADPKIPSKKSLLYVDDVSMIIKPAGKFFSVDLYMTYQITDPQKFTDKDTLEIRHYFALSKNIAITDSWLWVGDVIMKADILERYTAFTIYEGIVKRRRDPSVLYKNNEKNYEFRIFPLPAKESRRVKLSFLIASNEKGQIELPLGLFNDSHPLPPINVIQYLKDSDKKPVLSNGVPFTEGVHPELGPYKSAILKPTDYDPSDGEHSGIFFNHQQSLETLSLVATAPEEGEKDGRFQLSVNTAELLGIDTIEKNKIAFILDYQPGTNLFSKSEIIDALRVQIKSVVKRGDLFRVLYNQLVVKEVSEDWLTYNDLEDLDLLMSKIELGNSSLISSLLYEAYNYVKDDKYGLVFLMSSNNTFVTASSAQQLRNDLVAQVGELKQTFILDFAVYSNNTPKSFYDGIYYYGNDLLYKILSTNTKGKYLTMKAEGKKGKIYEFIEELSNSVLYSRFEYLTFNIKPQGGLSFDVYPVVSGKRTTYVGKYRGGFPFTIEFTAVYLDSLVNNTYIISNDITFHDKGVNNQCQAMGKIIYLESIQSATNDHLFNLVVTSLENRVLSRQTAFLALEPSLQQPCFDCLDESITGVSDQEIHNNVIVASPNPFLQMLKIDLRGVDNAADIDKVELIDINGRSTELILDWTRNDHGLVAEMDGSDLLSGMYIIRIIVKGKVYIVKVVKV
jgi:hypothetical protein